MYWVRGPVGGSAWAGALLLLLCGFASASFVVPLGSEKEIEKMTLRDPSNPARWSDGKPRSQANAFDVAWTPMHRFDTLKEQRHEAARRRTAKQVREARAAGRNLSVAALRKRAT